MNKPFALQTVLELMQTRADEATQRLARLVADERNARDKLTLLQGYRDEYAARFREAAQNGLSQHEWRNYREFLGRIDEAVAAQQKDVDRHAAKTGEGQENWREQRKKLKAFDTLSQRHHASEEKKTQKREQKTQDEFSARGRGGEGR